MPLTFKKKSDTDVDLAVWKITESEAYFKKKLLIHKDEEAIISKLSPRKLLEWLSSRYLLHLMSGRLERGAFIKDIHGKPHLVNSDHHVSISHSNDQVAVIASKSVVGIDIQHYVTKIYRIRHKFVNDIELQGIQEDKLLESLHVIWGAKESLYKAYGKRRLDFKKNIFISDLDLSADTGQFYGRVIKDTYDKRFKIYFRLFKNYTLVYAKEHS